MGKSYNAASTANPNAADNAHAPRSRTMSCHHLPRVLLTALMMAVALITACADDPSCVDGDASCALQNSRTIEQIQLQSDDDRFDFLNEDSQLGEFPPRTTARRPAGLIDPIDFTWPHPRVARPIPLPWVGPMIRQAVSEDIERVLPLLKERNGALSSADFETAVEDPRMVLLNICLSDRFGAQERSNAFDALALFPDEAVRALYAAVLGDALERGEQSMALAAIDGLFIGFGVEAVGDIALALDSDDARVRLSAVEALGDLGSDAGLARLSSHLKLEQSAPIREAIRKYLSMLG